MDNNIEIKLSLAGEDSLSQLKKSVYEEELKEINSKFIIKNNEMDINKTYYIKNDSKLEVGFFIRNATNKNISFENLALVIQDSKGSDILKETFNFKEYEPIPPYSARPFNLNFNLDDNIKFDDKEEYIIKFGNLDSYDVFSTIPTEIENMPIEISFEEERAIRDFVKELKTLEENEFTISVYSIITTSNGDINCTLIIRNSSIKTVGVEKLPITIINEDGIEVVNKVFENKDELKEIGSGKARIVNLEFKSNEITHKDFNISKCKVLYK